MNIKFPIMIHKTNKFELQQELLFNAMKYLGNAGFKLWCSLASDENEWIKLNVNSAANSISMGDGSTRKAVVELIENGFLSCSNESAMLFDFYFWGGDLNERC